MRYVRVLILFGFLGLLSEAKAHDPGLSSVSLALYSDRIEVVTTFSLVDARWLLADEKGTSPLSMEAERVRADLIRLPAVGWSLTEGAAELSAETTSVELAPGNNVVFLQRYPRPFGNAVRFDTRIFGFLPPGHRQHATVLQDKDHVVFVKLLSGSESGFVVPLPRAPITSVARPTAPLVGVSFIAFLRLGIEHILTGYDHLLFLFAFLITAKGIRAVLKIVTSFTLAHSITLALSALNVISLSPRWVEPLIAATIVFVALQNLLRRDHHGERVGLTFMFGLIHGFGFASVLREMGISSLGASAWRALAGFNAGVELGQVAVASLIFPILWYLRSRKNYERSWAPAASGLIALAGAYWFCQRVGGA